MEQHCWDNYQHLAIFKSTDPQTGSKDACWHGRNAASSEAAKTERPKATRNRATTSHPATCTKLKVHGTARSPADPRAKVSEDAAHGDLQCNHEPWMCPRIQVLFTWLLKPQHDQLISTGRCIHRVVGFNRLAHSSSC